MSCLCGLPECAFAGGSERKSRQWPTAVAAPPPPPTPLAMAHLAGCRRVAVLADRQLLHDGLANLLDPLLHIAGGRAGLWGSTPRRPCSLSRALFSPIVVV